MASIKSSSKDGQNIENSQRKPNAKCAHPHAESEHANQSAYGNKRRIHAANAKIRILLAIITTKNWRLWRSKDKYILPFALHAKAKKTQENYTNASDATVKRIGTSSVSRGSAAKITQHGVVWIAIFHHAKYAQTNL